MRWRLTFLGAGLFALVLTGCPMTDDYFIDSGATSAGATGGTRAMLQAGTAGASGSGSAAAGTNDSGGSMLGATLLSQGGDQAEAGAPTDSCVPSRERCNGRDDNCDGVVDEGACNSAANGTTGCSGFVLTAAPDHGYLLCTGTPRDFAQAKAACVAQGMRLVWLDSSQKNQALAAKVNSVVMGAEVLIGATDAEVEGEWHWDGGSAFWHGDSTGSPVNGSFVAWAAQAPNNGGATYGANEDCAVLHSSTATWGDRRCAEMYGYLCEEPE